MLNFPLPSHLKAVEYQGFVYVFNNNTGRLYKLDPTQLKDFSPQEILEVLNGEREAYILDVFTRIVGYYSKTSNWNRSKLGELKDRRRGHYDITLNTRKTSVPEGYQCSGGACKVVIGGEKPKVREQRIQSDTHIQQGRPSVAAASAD